MSESFFELFERFREHVPEHDHARLFLEALDEEGKESFDLEVRALEKSIAQQP